MLSWQRNLLSLLFLSYPHPLSKFYPAASDATASFLHEEQKKYQSSHHFHTRDFSSICLFFYLCTKLK